MATLNIHRAEPQYKDGLVAVGSRKHYKPCTSFHSMMEQGKVKAMDWARAEMRPQLYRPKVYNSFMRQQVQSLPACRQAGIFVTF